MAEGLGGVPPCKGGLERGGAGAVISGLFNASTLTSYITFCVVAGIGWLLYVQVWEKYAPKYYNTI